MRFIGDQPLGCGKTEAEGRQLEFLASQIESIVSVGGRRAIRLSGAGS